MKTRCHGNPSNNCQDVSLKTKTSWLELDESSENTTPRIIINYKRMHLFYQGNMNKSILKSTKILLVFYAVLLGPLFFHN